jgi:hypothetical protein
MKDSVQAKIDLIVKKVQLSNKSGNWIRGHVINNLNNDNLSKSIRDEKDAKIFTEELNAAISLAKMK